MAITDEMLAAENSHDVERVLACVTDDCLFEDVPFGIKAKGKNELRDVLQMRFAAAPDSNRKITSSMISGDQAAVEILLTGTHMGDIPGLPATGKRFEMRAVSILELKNGKVARRTDYWDAGSFFKQLGVTPQAA